LSVGDCANRLAHSDPIADCDSVANRITDRDRLGNPNADCDSVANCITDRDRLADQVRDAHCDAQCDRRTNGDSLPERDADAHSIEHCDPVWAAAVRLSTIHLDCRRTPMNNRFHTFRWLTTVALLIATALIPASSVTAAQQPPFDVQFSGVIVTVPATAAEPWVIAGQIVAVDATTRVRLSTGAVAVGMWADVTAKRLADDSLRAIMIIVRPPEVRLKGPVTAKAESGIGAWVVAGQTIWVTADTTFSQRGGPVDVGHWVEVSALEDPAGVLTALRVRGIELQETVEVFGAIQAYSDASWVVSAISAAVTPETLVMGEPQVGLLAHASALLLESGGLAALVLQPAWHEPGAACPRVQITGMVKSLPGGGLDGLWQVDGQSVEVTSSTVIAQAKGLVEVGAVVQATGWRSGDRVIAGHVSVLSSPSGGGQSFHLAGPIESKPDNGVLGAWTIGGQQIQVTRQTRLHGVEQARLGEPAEAGGLQQRDGVRIATWLRTRTQGGPGPQPSVTPQPSHTPSVTPGSSHTPSRTPQSSGTPGGGPQPTHTPRPGRP